MGHLPVMGEMAEVHPGHWLVESHWVHHEVMEMPISAWGSQGKRARNLPTLCAVHMPPARPLVQGQFGPGISLVSMRDSPLQRPNLAKTSFARREGTSTSLLHGLQGGS